MLVCKGYNTNLLLEVVVFIFLVRLEEVTELSVRATVTPRLGLSKLNSPTCLLHQVSGSSCISVFVPDKRAASGSVFGHGVLQGTAYAMLLQSM